MNVASGRSKPGRSMRVATVFTGVAAATVGMTQVANAQEVAHPAARPTSKNIARAVRPDGVYAGSIKEVPGCGGKGIDKTWVHISTGYYISAHNDETSWCYGFAGTYESPPGAGINRECGGNNYGYLMGDYYPTGSWFFNFGPGTTYASLNKSELQNVTIFSWSGKDTCPQAPGEPG
jgi:hypothetical protein